MSKITRFFAVVFDTPADKVRLQPEDFRPWTNSQPEEDMTPMVLHRAIRDRGGVEAGRPLPALVVETQPRGSEPRLPMMVFTTDYILHPE